MLLFVYGSLLRGLHNHCCLKMGEPDGAKFVKEDQINGELYSNGAYPFLYLSPTNEFVKGEIYEIQNLERCDRLESYRPDRPESENLFNRRVVKTVSGEVVYVYEGGDRFLKNIKSFQRVESNDWKSFFNKLQFEKEQADRVQEYEDWSVIEVGLDERRTKFSRPNADTTDFEYDQLKKIIYKIFSNNRANLSAEQINELFQRHHTKVQLIQCIILLLKEVEEYERFCRE